MGYWNGTRLKTSWLRLRGNASGRRRAHWLVPFFCESCQRFHGRAIMRNEINGLLFCDRAYYKLTPEVRQILLKKEPHP